MEALTRYQKFCVALVKFMFKTRYHYAAMLFAIPTIALLIYSTPTYLFMKYLGLSLAEGVGATFVLVCLMNAVYFVTMCWNYEPLATKNRE